jgi:hypothetical protein
MNIGLLKHDFRLTASWKVNKMLRVSILSFHSVIAGDRVLGPPLFHHAWLGLFTTISYDISFQSCCKMWICSPPRFILAVREFLNSMFLEQWIGWGRPPIWSACSSDLSSLDFFLWGHLQSTVCATEITEFQDLQQRMQNWLRWFVQHLEFSSVSCNHCIEKQRLALKLKVDTGHSF